MVFVHARNETVRTSTILRDTAKNNGDIKIFLPDQTVQYGDALKNVSSMPHIPLSLFYVQATELSSHKKRPDRVCDQGKLTQARASASDQGLSQKDVAVDQNEFQTFEYYETRCIDYSAILN